MAERLGPAIAGSSGGRVGGAAVIASRAVGGGRGGPLGINVGGIEAGRIGSISAREARIADTARSTSLRDFLNSSVRITRLDQIGVGNLETQNSAKTVKSLAPLPLFPMAKIGPPSQTSSEAKSNIVTFPEGRQARPIERRPILPQKEIVSLSVVRAQRASALRYVVQSERARAAGDIPITVPIEHQRLATRVRFALNRLIRVSKTRTNPSEKAAGLTKVESKLSSKTGFRVITQVHTEVQTKTGNILKPSTQNTNRRLERNSKLAKGQEQIRRKQRFIKIDDQTYADRLASLNKTLGELKALNPMGNINGRGFSKATEIFTNRFKSNIFRQLGLEKDREDGSVYGLIKDLIAKEAIAPGDLESANRNNAPVEIARRPTGQLASHQEVQKVWHPPKNPPEDLPPVLIREQVEVVRASQQATIVDPDSISVRETGSQENVDPKPSVTESTDKIEDLNVPISPIGSMRLLDIRSNYNNIVGLESSILEREALMAA